MMARTEDLPPPPLLRSRQRSQTKMFTLSISVLVLVLAVLTHFSHAPLLQTQSIASNSNSGGSSSSNKEVGNDEGVHWGFLFNFDDRYNFFEHKTEYLSFHRSVEGFLKVVQIRGLNVYEPIGNIIKSVLMILFDGYEDTRSLRLASLGFHFINSILIFIYSFVLIAPPNYNSSCESRSFVNSKVPLPLFFSMILVAVVFYIHPLNVQVVAWLSAAQYTMALCFSLISSILLELYVIRADRPPTMKVVLMNLFPVSFFVAAVLCKAPTVMVALVHIFRIATSSSSSSFRFQTTILNYHTFLLIATWLAAFFVCYITVSSANQQSNNADFEFDIGSIGPIDYLQRRSRSRSSGRYEEDKVSYQILEAWEVVGCILVRAVVIIRDFTIRLMYPVDLRIHYMVKDIGHYNLIPILSYVFNNWRSDSSIDINGDIGGSSSNGSDGNDVGVESPIPRIPKYSRISRGEQETARLFDHSDMEMEANTITVLLFVIGVFAFILLPLLRDILYSLQRRGGNGDTDIDKENYNDNNDDSNNTNRGRSRYNDESDLELYNRRHRSTLMTSGWFSYLVLMIPGLNLINHGWVQLGADRYCYFPMAYAAPAFSLALHYSLMHDSFILDTGVDAYVGVVNNDDGDEDSLCDNRTTNNNNSNMKIINDNKTNCDFNTNKYSRSSKQSRRRSYWNIFSTIPLMLLLSLVVVSLMSITRRLLPTYSQDRVALEHCLRMDKYNWDCAGYLSQLHNKLANNKDKDLTLAIKYLDQSIDAITISSASVKNCYFKSACYFEKLSRSHNASRKDMYFEPCKVVNYVFMNKIKPFVNVLRTDIIFMGLSNYAICQMAANSQQMSITSRRLLRDLSELIVKSGNCRVIGNIAYFTEDGFQASYPVGTNTCSAMQQQLQQLSGPALVLAKTGHDNTDESISTFVRNIDLLILYANGNYSIPYSVNFRF